MIGTAAVVIIIIIIIAMAMRSHPTPFLAARSPLPLPLACCSGFLPSTGRLSSYIPPSTFAPRDPELAVSIREDAGVTQGSEISMFYDPMICKLITHDDTRIRALDRMTAALDSYVVRGVGHNISFLRDLTVHPAYRAGDMNTG